MTSTVSLRDTDLLTNWRQRLKEKLDKLRCDRSQSVLLQKTESGKQARVSKKGQRVGWIYPERGSALPFQQAERI